MSIMGNVLYIMVLNQTLTLKVGIAGKVYKSGLLGRRLRV